MHYLFLNKKVLREPKRTNPYAGKTKAHSKFGSHNESYGNRSLRSAAAVLDRRFDAALVKCSRGSLTHHHEPLMRALKQVFCRMMVFICARVFPPPSFSALPLLLLDAGSCSNQMAPGASGGNLLTRRGVFVNNQSEAPPPPFGNKNFKCTYSAAIVPSVTKVGHMES